MDSGGYATMRTGFVGLQEIATSWPLLSFDKDDVAAITKWANQIRKDGSDIYLSKFATQDRDMASWINAGLIVLQSQSLGVEILLIKAKAEKEAHRQGGMYQSFVGNYVKDLWHESATFKSLHTGLETIANICPPSKALPSKDTAPQFQGLEVSRAG